MTTRRPPVARRCEDCGLVLVTAYRRCCPECGGWMLTTKKIDTPDMEDAADMTPIQSTQRAGHNITLRECDSNFMRAEYGVIRADLPD